MTVPPAECWLHPDVMTAPSDIAGKGLFTSAPITAGTPVLRTTAARPSSTPDDRLGNHSCDPNLWWADATTLVARRDIDAGEELTYDYSTSTAEPTYLLRCHCESTRCRGMVTGDDWRIPELQQRYAGHWLPAVRRHVRSG